MNILDRVQIVLGLKTEGFQGAQQAVNGFTDRAHHELGQLKTAIAGYFTFEAAKELVNAVREMATRWAEVAEQTGMSTTEVQKWDAAAKKVGLTVEDMARSFDTLLESRSKALKPGGAAEFYKLQALGLSREEIEAANTGSKMARAVGEHYDSSKREAAVEMFGARRAGKTIAAFKSMAEGGGDVSTMDEKSVEEMKQASIRMERAMTEFKVASAPLVVALFRFIAEAAKWFITPKDKPEGLDRLNPANVGKVYKQNQSIADQVVETAETDAQNDEMEHRLALAKKRGVKASSLQLGNKGLDYDESPEGYAKRNTLNRAAAGNVEHPETAEENRIKHEEQIKDIYLKFGNKQQKKEMLDERMAEKKAEMEDYRNKAKTGPASEAAGNFKKADEAEKELYKLGGERAELEKKEAYMPKADALAAVGGMIGGAAAAIDPSLIVQQNLLEVVKKILDDLKKPTRPERIFSID